jgi:hypothetical protein
MKRLLSIACIGGGVFLAPTHALGASCAADIAEFEGLVREGKAQPTARQSIESGFVIHQPTPASIARAQERAGRDLARLFRRAKAFDAQGNEAKCEKTVAIIRLRLGL